MPRTKIGSKWDSGNLVFTNSAGTTLLTLDDARDYEYDEIPTYTYLASIAGTLGNAYAAAIHSGSVVEIGGVTLSAVTSGFTMTVYASAVSAGTLSFATGATTGTAYVTAVAGAIDQAGLIRFYAVDSDATGTCSVQCHAVIRR